MGRAAKPLRPNVLDPKLSCSWQDVASDASDRDAAAVDGWSLPVSDWFGGAAGRSQDAGHATSSGYPTQLGDTRGHSQLSYGDIRCAADAGTRLHRRLLAGDDTGKAETIFDSKDNGASCSNRLLGRLRDESPRKRQTSKTINAI